MAARAGTSSSSPTGEVAFGTGAAAAFVQAAGDTTGGSPQGGTSSRSRSTRNVTGIAASQINVDGPGRHIGTATLHGLRRSWPGRISAPSLPHGRCDHTACPAARRPCRLRRARCCPRPSARRAARICRPATRPGVKFNDAQPAQRGPGRRGARADRLDDSRVQHGDHGVGPVDGHGGGQPGSIPPTPDGFYSFILGPGSYTVCEAAAGGVDANGPDGGVAPGRRDAGRLRPVCALPTRSRWGRAATASRSVASRGPREQRLR